MVMSVVTNIILTATTDESGVIELNKRLLADIGCYFNKVDAYAGGNKHIEADVWMIAINHFDRLGFMQHIKSVYWEAPDVLAVFVLTENVHRKFVPMEVL
jgi:hypothetical protein